MGSIAAVDRRYIEGFLNARRGVIHGAVLEVQDDTYTMRFGEDRVSRRIVVDIDATNPNATLVADLQLAGALPPDSYAMAKWLVPRWVCRSSTWRSWVR